MNAHEADILLQLAAAWREMIFEQGTETEVLAHEAWVLDKCSRELKEHVAVMVDAEKKQ